MTNYYSILGLTKEASDTEIKAAFRKLAKVYHPDKNPNDPNAKVVFENILKAYHILLNPYSRKKHDYELTNRITQSSKKQSTNTQKQKDYSFTEEELNRRQFYKNYYDARKNKVESSTQVKIYSDYKYILFATPVAVGLLMLIISLFDVEPKVKLNLKKQLTDSVMNQSFLYQPENGYKPYNSLFGNIQTFNTDNVLRIKNLSGYDAVIIVFNREDSSYLQHTYLRDSYYAEFNKLPDAGLYWKCWVGKNWNDHKLSSSHQIIGGFDSTVQYQNWIFNPILFNQDSTQEIVLSSIANSDMKNKHCISNELEFFTK
jgi:hypothetical protein